MAQLVNLKVKRPIKAIFYGYPGSTKTRTAYTAAWDERTAPALALDAFGNPEGAADYQVAPDIIAMEKLEDFNDPYDWLRSGQKPNHPLVAQFNLHPPYRTIIVDTLTQVQRMYFDRKMGVADHPISHLVRKREWDDYNAVLYTMIRFCTYYFSLAELGLNVIMTAQEREGDPDTGRPIGPHLEGQGVVEIMGQALIVARMMHVARASKALEKIMIEQKALSIASFAPSHTYTAKDQWSGGRLGDYMFDPTITKMLDAVDGGTAPADETTTKPKP